MARFHCPRFVGARPGTLAVGLLVLAPGSETSAPGRLPSPTPEVSVIPAQSQSVPITQELVGQLAPTRVAEVRARVAGIVLARTYSEDTDVDHGEVLFRIDPARLEAALHAAEAALAQAIVTSSWTLAPPAIDHYNGYGAVQINGEPTPGLRSGQATQAMAANEGEPKARQ
jgi:multidrug efflux pump subunit AcrA (membrane-fusion protein)